MTTQTQSDLSQQLELEELVGLRHNIHQQPELSHNESQTAQRIKEFLAQYEPSDIIENISGVGLIAIWTFTEDGPTVLFRCELDALPIQEVNDIPYKSTFDNVGHKCGHDGHMASVAGVAQLLHKKPFKHGKVMLLFQPAEETGEGAAMMLADEKMNAIQPDYVFAYHNLPGYQLGKVLTKENTFAPASAGMGIKLEGIISHAGEPENGNSPALAMANIISKITSLPKQETYDGFVLTTITHTMLGERAFGILPGHAEVMATLRAHDDSDLAKLKRDAEKIVRDQAAGHDLQYGISYQEVFPTVRNSSDASPYLNRAISASGLDHSQLQAPVRWSEDFGHFTQRFPGALFCLGSGEQQPSLHNADYDYPDELLSFAVELFYNIAEQILGAERKGS